MKPNFALNITDTDISLLHRTSRGWVEVGTVGFDNPDLDEALGYLRASALGLSPHGITTKLILPPAQVRFTEVEVAAVEGAAPDKAAREAQIRAALEGHTPYNVEDLVFDWWGTGPKIKVAVVARETLEEAESFAEAHRFNPVSFVTTPAEGQFAGEPWFGMTKGAAALLPDGEKVTRDQDPVKVITRDVPKTDEAEAKKAAEAATAKRAEEEAQQAAAAKAAEAEQEKADAIAAQQAVQNQEAAAKARADAEADAEAIRKTEAAKAEMERRAQDLAQAEAKRLVEEAEKAKAAQAEREKAKAALIEAERKREAEKAAEAATFKGVTDPTIAETDDSPKAAGAFASRRRDEVSQAPALGAAANPAAQGVTGGAALKAPAPPSIPSISATGAGRAQPDAPKLGAPAVSRPQTKPEDKAEAKPLIGAFVANAKAQAAKTAMLRATGATPPRKDKEASPAQDIGTAQKPEKAAALTGAKVRPKTDPETVGAAARVPGTSAALSRFKSKVKIKPPSPATKEQIASTGKAADASLSSFGTKVINRRGKPRFLGLILTLILLGLLAAVAAWSSIYLSRDDSAPQSVQQAQSSAAPTDSQIAEPTSVPSTDSPETTVATDPALDPEAVADAEAAADAEAELPPVEEIAAAEPEVSAQTPETVSPGLSSDATADPANAVDAQAEAPNRGPQDEIFLATIDDPKQSFDAVALPRPQNGPDAAPTAVVEPPPFGTQYEFEPDGTIKATANGVIMPGGFSLIAARPPVEPPARPAAISDPVAPDANAAATPPPPGASTNAAGASTAGVARTDGPNAEGTGPSFVFGPDATVENRRPANRPTIPEPATAPADPQDNGALTPDPALQRLASLRPRVRSQTVVAAADTARKAAEAASLAATAAAQQKADQDSALVVALSPRPAARPRDFSGAVEAAIASATRASTRQVVAPEAVPEPEQADEPEVKVSSAPRIPTRANVAKQATFKSAINLSKTNLIGVYGSDSKRYALIRSSSGRYSKVKVGDKVDGGTVAAITRNEVRYRKGSKMLTLAMPNG